MDSPRSEALIDAYFARLNAQLGTLPEEQRRELEQELRQHLAALVAAHEELGRPPEEATAAALARFGDPVRIGRQLTRESRGRWACGAAACGRSRWVRAALLIGVNAVAWTFGGMMKTGGAFPASLRDAPWGALIGLAMWLAEQWLYYRTRSES
jgi:hypothetical protein